MDDRFSRGNSMNWAFQSAYGAGQVVNLVCAKCNGKGKINRNKHGRFSRVRKCRVCRNGIIVMRCKKVRGA